MSRSPTAKRALDLVALACTAPLFMLLTGALALLVLLVDGRPIFFGQRRLGQHRQPFWIWKLRTMTTQADPTQRRATRLGETLRRRGLDELPQLWSVLVGDMSLVGPRALTPTDAQRLIDKHPPFAARYALKPGITGLAQVYPSTGVESTARWDRTYLEQGSVWRDLAILTRTAYINVVGKARGRRSIPIDTATLGGAPIAAREVVRNA